MSGNERVLKVLPLLTTPDEANRGCSEATLAGPFSPWAKVRMRVRAHPHRPRRRYECNQMQSNATELKFCHSWPLLTRLTRANQCHSEATLAHRVRVSGVPNEATVASFSASLPGVNRANQGQMGPRFRPPVRERINLLIPQRASVLC